MKNQTERARELTLFLQERCGGTVVLHSKDNDIASIPEDVDRVVMWTGCDVFTVYLKQTHKKKGQRVGVVVGVLGIFT